jgi:nitroreductase
MALLNLTADEVLTTTRTVRKRLDFQRPVEPEVIRECVEIALQAPSGSNRQRWHFMVVADEAKRKALGDLYKRAVEEYISSPYSAGKLFADDPQRSVVQKRVESSVAYLGEHMHEAPILLIPCFAGRPDGQPASNQASPWGSIIPATWSFMLAARNRGLGTAWTTLHLEYEEEAANILGIPYKEITQVALIPVAYTIGTSFKPAPREPIEKVLHWDQW